MHPPNGGLVPRPARTARRRPRPCPVRDRSHRPVALPGTTYREQGDRESEPKETR
ncbi:hypothetical protein Ae168Ps1_3870c [Pseudonocardia sp. Ae168_Ps1]|nr:hypothetical protein Ae150APs1_3847c [Pseudonocardia sp. Ae150A_Ps1]OLL81464.1 hypothetical protein Ae168Ps1_3870c [Pseudonocardia sp. Ae168_Ps1]OLL84422.1 hypothetical protein Ae263Ps1_1477 [Pseudonocardia sp. Ae263_Ps1]OLL95560.1 hypothetical protein Ae356Ps1_5457c [Pseudonocardia sp. Ae356_Ps1]